jgi:predicted metal-dependent hydrolase
MDLNNPGGFVILHPGLFRQAIPKIKCYNQMMNDQRPFPLIVGFIADLMFAVKVEDVALRLNFQVEMIERADQIAPLDPDTPPRQLAEHMVGPGAVLLDKLTLWQPALIIFDLGNPEVPWRDWVALIKSVPATRRIPVICFGSHVDVETMKAAKSAGADSVLARSRFVSDLPALIQKYARQPDYPALEESCQLPISKLALKGLEEFNRGEYFEAHEYLEEAWNEDETVGRELYRAILQVAVAYLQIERGNYNGAIKMFLRVRQWIDPLPDQCRGINVAKLRDEAKKVHATLISLGRERMSEFDRNLLRPVQYRWEP